MTNPIPASSVSVPTIDSSKGMPWYRRWFYILFAIKTEMEIGPPVFDESSIEPVKEKVKPAEIPNTLGESILMSLEEHEWKIDFGEGHCSDHVYFTRSPVKISASMDLGPEDEAGIYKISLIPRGSKIDLSIPDKKKIQRRLFILANEKYEIHNDILAKKIHNQLFNIK